MNLLKYGKLQVDPAKLSETVNVRMQQGQRATILSESSETHEFLMPRIEAIHAGRTRNYNHYPADKLRGDASIQSGVYSWLQPYAKPVIYNHDTNTEATGRIYSAAYAEYTQAGRPGIIVVPKITESNAMKALKDGRLLTVSIGATSDAAICSICGTDIINEGYCGHMKGEIYDGRTAEWITGNLWFDELSWVNVPADKDAMVVDTQSSIFLDVPRESDTTEQSASSDLTLNEYYGVPKATRLIVVESKELKSKEAEIKKQEENQEMENENQPETVVTETPVVETETPETEVPETPVVEETPVEETEPSSEGETPETETVVTQEEDSEEATILLTAESIGEHPDTTALREANASLLLQVEGLTKEIKALYIERIVEQSALPEEKAVALSEKLAGRSIDSLRDRLEDMKEGFAAAPVVEVAKEEPKARVITKVASPVPTTESAEKKEMTNEGKLEFFKQLLK